MNQSTKNFVWFALGWFAGGFAVNLVWWVLTPNCAEAASPRATGIVQTTVVEHFLPDGSVDTSQPPVYRLRRSARRHVDLAPDPRLVPGAKMRLRGAWDADGALVVGQGEQDARLLRPPAFTPARAEERLVVLPVYFTEQAPYRSSAEIAGTFASLATWFSRASYGRTRITTTAEDWRLMVGAATQPCNFVRFVTDVMAAFDEQVDYRTVTLVNIVTPERGRMPPWQGCAGVGGVGTAMTGPIDVQTDDGMVRVGVIVTPEWVPALPHEVGHALGLSHANGLVCPPGDPLPESLTGCVDREYGDPFDTMGSGLGEFGVLRKMQLGWLTTTGSETYAEVDRPGTFTLDPLSLPAAPGTTSRKGLLLKRAGGPASWLVLEARSATLNDRAFPWEWYDGLIVRGSFAHRKIGTAQMLPGSQHHVWPHGGTAKPDAVLPVGESLDDGPWRITVLARSATGSLTVRIDDLAPLPPPTPTPVPCATPTCLPGEPCGGCVGGSCPSPPWWVPTPICTP